MYIFYLIGGEPASRGAGGVGGADKKWKGNFWFCFAVSVSEKNNLILTFLFALFSTLTATEAPPLRVLW